MCYTGFLGELFFGGGRGASLHAVLCVWRWLIQALLAQLVTVLSLFAPALMCAVSCFIACLFPFLVCSLLVRHPMRFMHMRPVPLAHILSLYLLVVMAHCNARDEGRPMIRPTMRHSARSPTVASLGHAATTASVVPPACQCSGTACNFNSLSCLFKTYVHELPGNIL